jgi:Fe-S-cluster containining protein
LRKPWQVDFECSGCGACCRAISCAMLDRATNLCTVYENRPDFCRVGYSREEGEALSDYVSRTKMACMVLADAYPGDEHDLLNPDAVG